MDLGSSVPTGTACQPTEKSMCDLSFPLCSRAWALEDLEIINECRCMYTVLDFTPGEENIAVWANQAYLDMTGQTLEEYRSTITASQISVTVATLNMKLYENIQVLNNCEQTTKVLYPKGKPVTFEFLHRPFKLIRRGEERTVILNAINSVHEDRDKNKFVLLEEMLRYTHVTQMYVDRKSLDVIAGNQPAWIQYSTTSDMRKADRALRLEDIFSTIKWDSPRERDSAWERVTNLTLQSQPYELECKKLAAGDGLRLPSTATEDETWHKLVWIPSVHPESGADAILLNEYDVTQLKRVQAELVAANVAQEQAFASISHELRTPLSGIIGLADALSSMDGVTPSVAKTLNVIKSSGLRLAGLVNDILDAASFHRQRLVMQHSQCDLADVAQGVCDLVRPLVKKKVQLINNITDLPTIEGDANRLTQILTNLVSNAIKFTDKGSILLRGEALGTSHVRIQVVDTGLGIPQDKLSNIWGAFDQVDIATTRKYGGTGLGLTLVRGLVEAHGGSVDVTSHFGSSDSGTTFTITLPLSQTATDLRESPKVAESAREEDDDEQPEKKQREVEEKEDGGHEGGDSAVEGTLLRGEQSGILAGAREAESVMPRFQSTDDPLMLRSSKTATQAGDGEDGVLDGEEGVLDASASRTALQREIRLLHGTVDAEQAKAEELARELKQLQEHVRVTNQSPDPTPPVFATQIGDEKHETRELDTVEREQVEKGVEDLVAWTMRAGNLLTWQQTLLAKSRAVEQRVAVRRRER